MLHAGQLGTGSFNNTNVPTKVVGSQLKWHSVSMAYGHTCGILASSTGAACFGSNEWGQLGTGDSNTTNVPTAVAGGRWEFLAISAGYGSTCAIQARPGGSGTSGPAFCWCGR